MTSSDQITQIFRSISKSLGSDHKVRVMIGILFGNSISALVSPLDTTFPESATAQYLSAIPELGLLSFGVLAVFAPLAFGRNVVPERYGRIFDTMDEAIHRGNFPEFEQRAVYREFLKKVIERFDSSQDEETDYNDILEEAVKNTKNPQNENPA